jgi:Zn-dependent M28 family amino/carboxypeptidase
MNNDPSSDPNLFAGPVRLYYGRWSYKFEEAARRGAVGAIVIHTTPSAGYPFQVIQNGHGREDFWLPFKPEDPTMAVRSWCSEDAARKMVALGGHDLDALRKTAETRAFKPVPLGVRVDLKMTNRVRSIVSANVIGKLEGSDPALKSEAVVVTAHFDHLGIRAPKHGDSIYNGALDNASGCAAVLNLARAAGALKTKPKRTILFTFVTAEESGLLGSLFYARNPTIPREKIVANYNLDSINIWGATKDIAMVGYGKNSLTGVADQVARRRGRVLTANPDVSLGLFYRSDHFSFARVGIPSAYFKAGSDFYENKRGKNLVKGAYTRTRYHQPNDEFHAKWDLRGAVEDTKLVLECLLVTANAADAPKWAPGDEFEKLR